MLKNQKIKKGVGRSTVGDEAKSLSYMCKIWQYLGGSPCLVVMGDDSRSQGCGFESRDHKLDGHFSH